MRAVLIFVIVVVLAAGGYYYLSNSKGSQTGDDKTVGEQTDGADTAAPSDEAQRSAGLSDAPLIPRKLLFGNPERSQARISPDGKQMSFLAPKDGVLNVFVAPLGEFDKARAVTNDTGRGIRFHTWAWNGEQVIYVQDVGGNEDYHAFAVDLKSGTTKDLTPFEKTRVQPIAVDSDSPDTVIVGLNNRDPRWHDPHLLNLRTGELTRLEENTGFAGYVADNDLKLRLASKPRPDGGLDVLKKTGDEWKPFLDIPNEDALTTNFIGFSDDNSTVYALWSQGRDKIALVGIEMESGETSVIAESAQADVGGTVIDPATDAPVAYSVNYLRRRLHSVGDAVAEDLKTLSDKIDGDLSITSVTADFGKWIVHAQEAQAPGTYYLYDRADGSVRKLFTTRPDLEKQPLVPQHPLEIKARDGLTLVSYLSLPPGSDADGNGRPDQPVPMVLTVHGGPWGRDSYGYAAWDQWLANRGYATLSVNFRASTGFGKAFVIAGDKEWAGKMHNDLIDAVNWAVDEQVTEADKVAIMGGSYGGYATLVGLTFTPDTFACGVDIVGPSNLVTLLNSIPPYWTALLEQFALRVGDPRTEEGRALLTERSPLTRVDRISKPLLIGQGANDPRVKQAESDQIVNAMQEKNLNVTYVLYPDEGHGFARPENRIAFYAITEGFLSTCLGGRYEEIGDAFEGSSTTVPTGAEHVPGLEAALQGFEPRIAK